MGNAKSVPVVGEAVTVIESGVKIASAGVLVLAGETEEAKKLAKGAGQSWVEYSEKSIITGPINAGIRLAIDDKEGAKRVIKSTGEAVESVVDSTPVLGHAKGVYHYLNDEEEHGNRCMVGASRGAAVMGVGLATGGLGAPVVAGGLAGVGAGVAFDGVHSAIDSGVHGERRSHGIWNIDRDIKEVKDSNDVADFGLGFLGSVAGDFMAGAAGAEAGKSLRKANKIKVQKNKLKKSFKNAPKIPDPELAYKDTIKAAKKLHKMKKNGTLKGDYHVSTRVRNMKTKKVSQGYNARARSDINVKKFKTNGKRSGFANKTQAKNAPYKGEPSKLMKRQTNVKPKRGLNRRPQACAEHQAFDGFYKNGSSKDQVQVVSVQLKNGIIRTKARCGNCQRFAMGKVATDAVAGMAVPVGSVTVCVSKACKCGALAAGATIIAKNK